MTDVQIPKPDRGVKPDGYYVYIHIDHLGRVFYVGKGKDWRGWCASSRSAEWREVAQNGYSVRVLKSQLSECCAITLEKIIIGDIGVGNLTNKSTGGEGSSGAIRSAESRARYSASKMGNRSRTGIPHTEETKRKIGAKHKGKFVGEETRRKLSAHFSCKDVLHFVHDDGDEFVGIRSDFIRKYSMHKGAVWAMLNGKSKQVKGWRLK